MARKNCERYLEEGFNTIMGRKSGAEIAGERLREEAAGNLPPRHLILTYPSIDICRTWTSSIFTKYLPLFPILRQPKKISFRFPKTSKCFRNKPREESSPLPSLTSVALHRAVQFVPLETHFHPWAVRPSQDKGCNSFTPQSCSSLRDLRVSGQYSYVIKTLFLTMEWL
ncbi:hypothetical protein J6590_035712 [Homalodisca vitripennis]|nr:hypothetical protein J6590_035712 [Homalodisca vitripennis]